MVQTEASLYTSVCYFVNYVVMPIVLIIIGLAVAVGVGGYFLRPEEVVTPKELSESPEHEDITNEIVIPRENNLLPEANENTNSEVSESSSSIDSELETTLYADGAHTVNSAYVAPGNANHTLAVTLTLKDDVVTASTIKFGGDTIEASSNFQQKFTAAYQSQVIGKKIDDIKLSRVGGASLTTKAFNEAVAKVKAVAAN
jgi:hypothetical protein